jgi:hypothetical protein
MTQMPDKSVITLTELILLSTVWGATLNAWKPILSGAFTQAAGLISPGATKFYKEMGATAMLFVVLYALIFAFENVQIGRSSVFELK